MRVTVVRVAIVVVVLSGLTGPALAQQQTLQGSATYQNTLISPNSTYPGPYYVWSDGTHHTQPQPQQPQNNPSPPPPPQPQRPRSSGGGPLQGNAQIPGPIQATIQQNDPEAQQGPYKQGVLQTNQGPVYITVSDTHCNGWQAGTIMANGRSQPRGLVPSGYWTHVDGYVIRSSTGQDSFHITALYNQYMSTNHRQYDVRLSPNRVVNCGQNVRKNSPQPGPKAQGGNVPANCSALFAESGQLQQQMVYQPTWQAQQAIKQQLDAVEQQLIPCRQAILGPNAPPENLWQQFPNSRPPDSGSPRACGQGLRC